MEWRISMITYKTGNLLDSPESHIAHGCNCQGKMNSGVAKAIRERWPNVYEDYIQFDKEIGLRPGDITVTQLDDNKFVANLMTQTFYGYDKRQYVDYDALRTCFQRLKRIMKPEHSLAIPKIGAGLGGGDWKIIEQIIEKEMHGVDVTCYVL